MKKPGQIVLFQFPDTDLSAGKLRPALLLGEVPGRYEDWLICMISSQLHQQIKGFDEVIHTDDSDFAQSGLKKASVLRVARLAVVEGKILKGSIGRIGETRLHRIRRTLAQWINPRR